MAVEHRLAVLVPVRVFAGDAAVVLDEAVECLAVGDLYGLSGPESQGFDTWAAANDLAADLGGTGDLPDAPLAITGPGEESGTYSSYVELALEDIAEEREQPGAQRLLVVGDVGGIAAGVEGTQGLGDVAHEGEARQEAQHVHADLGSGVKVDDAGGRDAGPVGQLGREPLGGRTLRAALLAGDHEVDIGGRDLSRQHEA